MTYQCCLNNIDRVSTFWRVLEQFSDNLRCCPNMFSSTESRVACTRCNSNRVRSLSAVHEYHRVAQSVNKRHHTHHHSSYNSGVTVASHNTRNESSSFSSRTESSRPEHLPSIGYSMSSFDFGTRRDSECDSPSATSASSRKDSVFEPSTLTGLRSAQSTEDITRLEKRESAKREAIAYRAKDIALADKEEPKSKKKKSIKMKGLFL